MEIAARTPKDPLHVLECSLLCHLHEGSRKRGCVGELQRVLGAALANAVIKGDGDVAVRLVRAGGTLELGDIAAVAMKEMAQTLPELRQALAAALERALSKADAAVAGRLVGAGAGFGGAAAAAVDELPTRVRRTPEIKQVLAAALESALTEGDVGVVTRLVRIRATFRDGATAAMGKLARGEGGTPELQQVLAAALHRAVARTDVHFAMGLVRAGVKLGDATAAAVTEIVNAFPQNRGPASDRTPSEQMDIVADRIYQVARVLRLQNKRDEQGRTPLHYAAEEGRAAAVRALMMFGAKSSAREYAKEMSPLDLAATRGHAEVVRVMVQLGANVNVRVPHGRTALHCARGGAVVDALVEAGAKIEASKCDGTTPLRRAARRADLAAAGALVRHGANVNANDSNGSTPLHYVAGRASRQNSAVLVDMLMRSGADETLVDRRGETPARVVDARSTSPTTKKVSTAC